MKQIHYKKIFLSLAIAGIAAITWAHYRDTILRLVLVKEQQQDGPAQQQEWLKELNTVMQRFSKADAPYYAEGLLTAIDKVDPGHALREVPFAQGRSGSTVYYRLGPTETVYTPEIYIVADHDAQKLFIGAPRQAEYPGPLSLTQLSRLLSEEGYHLQKQAAQRMATLSLVNEAHLSCKEYSLTYDTASLAIQRIFIRQPDSEDPADAAREKWITLAIHQWKEAPNASTLFDPSRFVEKTASGWQPAVLWRHYQIVNL